jgi:transcriptional regulator
MTWNEYQALRARGRKLLRLRAKGWTWKRIGRQLGVSTQRAHQIWRAIEEKRGPYEGLL